MNGGSEELENYILRVSGISRTALNVMGFIGVFIFGWLIAIAGLRQVEPSLGLLVTQYHYDKK